MSAPSPFPGERTASSRRAPDVNAKCTICGRLVVEHKAGTCPWCFGPLDHHEPGREELCRQGKARMARARQLAGRPLTAIDHRALAKEPAS